MTPAIWVGGGVALAAAAVIGWQGWQISGLEERVVKLEREKGEATQAVSQWKAQAESCSAATATLTAQGTRARLAYEASLKAALEGTAHAQATARGILAAERPAGLDECQAARLQLEAEIDRRHP